MSSLAIHFVSFASDLVFRHALIMMLSGSSQRALGAVHRFTTEFLAAVTNCWFSISIGEKGFTCRIWMARWFQRLGVFLPLGEMIQFDYMIFQMDGSTTNQGCQAATKFRFQP